MKVELLELNGFIPMNVFIIVKNNKCLIVDPGYDKDTIIRHVNTKKYKVEGILLTHGHLDHIQALDCYKVPVYTTKKSMQMVKDDNINGMIKFGQSMPFDPSILDFVMVKDLEEFTVGEFNILPIFTPGHTSGSVCFKIDNHLFTGDTLFKGAIGRYDLDTGNQEESYKSLVKLIDNYEGCIAYPAHGPATTIDDEKNSNQYYLIAKR